MTVATRTDVLEAARSLETLIRDHADVAEAQRKLTPEVLDALRVAGLTRLYVPEGLGGLEVDPVTGARAIEEVSRFHSAAGWAITNTNAIDLWLGRLPAEGAEEMTADGADVINAASFHPPITAREVDGGFRLTGRGPLASIVSASTWLMFTAVVTDGDEPRTMDGNPVVIGAFVRTAEAQVFDTWHTLGMRATDSNDVAVDDVFVPARRTFPMQPEYERNRHYTGPLYRFPVAGAAVGPIAPAPLGVARAALDAFRELASKTPFGAVSTLRDRPTVHARLGRAEAVLRSGRALFYETMGDVWERTVAGQDTTLADKADVMLAAAHAVRSAVEAVDLVYGLAGSTAIYARHPLERHFRDIQTLRHHGFVNESRYETAAQVYLGVEPEFGMVAM